MTRVLFDCMIDCFLIWELDSSNTFVTIQDVDILIMRHVIFRWKIDSKGKNKEKSWYTKISVEAYLLSYE